MRSQNRSRLLRKDSTCPVMPENRRDWIDEQATACISDRLRIGEPSTAGISDRLRIGYRSAAWSCTAVHTTAETASPHIRHSPPSSLIPHLTHPTPHSSLHTSLLTLYFLLLTSYFLLLPPSPHSSLLSPHPSHQKREGKNKEAAGTAASLFEMNALYELRRDDEVRDLPHRAPRGPMQSVQEHQGWDQVQEAWYQRHRQ